ncbi:hypothetical protein [Alteromonas sp. S015]|uniref:hypothetical protein n=1 Tax=Alteromonas sp. S015 TaxID=3117401 RepID=UPI002FE3A582
MYTRAFADNDYGNYQVAVLNAIFEATKEYGDITLVPHPQPMTQSRQVASLLNGEADVIWSVTNKAREQKLIPIRFPLLKGFAGLRVFVIHPARQNELHKDVDSRTLRNLTMVQGSDWPDIDVLTANGFNVEGEDWSLWFGSMYSMVSHNLVDAFPRNIIEVHRDLERHQDKHVSLEQFHLLKYPNYEYFFVRPDHPALANRLRLGLIRILENGKLERIFNSFEGHRKAELLADTERRKVHQLDNPTIPYQLNYARWDKHRELAISALKKEMSQ